MTTTKLVLGCAAFVVAWCVVNFIASYLWHKYDVGRRRGR